MIESLAWTKFAYACLVVLCFYFDFVNIVTLLVSIWLRQDISTTL